MNYMPPKDCQKCNGILSEHITFDHEPTCPNAGQDTQIVTTGHTATPNGATFTFTCTAMPSDSLQELVWMVAQGWEATLTAGETPGTLNVVLASLSTEALARTLGAHE
jgi:hypothetical protein